MARAGLSSPGFPCPCGKTEVESARPFRHSKRGLVAYRCKHCDQVYNLYTGMVFAGCGLSARQAVLLVRGVCKGESGATVAEDFGVRRMTPFRGVYRPYLKASLATWAPQLNRQHLSPAFSAGLVAADKTRT